MAVVGCEECDPNRRVGGAALPENVEAGETLALLGVGEAEGTSEENRWTDSGGWKAGESAEGGTLLEDGVWIVVDDGIG